MDHRLRRALRVPAAVALSLMAAAPVAACTGELVPLEEIVRTSRAIVVASIVEVGPGQANDVPGSWTFQVEQTLHGQSDARFRLDWPFRVSVCDGFSGSLGDRLVIALDAVGFFQTMHPVWLLETSGDRAGRPGVRDDLDLLLVRLGARLDDGASPSRGVDPSLGAVALAITAAVIATFGVVWLAATSGRERQRGGL